MQLLLAITALIGVASCSPTQSVLHGKEFSQQFRDNYNVLKHVGYNGPYSDRRSYGIDRETPDSCSVEQVIMIMRHGERFPAPSVGKQIEGALQKIYSSNITKFQGDLEFLNSGYKYFVPNQCAYNAETSSGPYAGLLEAYKRGSEYAARYGHLWDGETIEPIFTSGYQRVIATAREFGQGFFSTNYSTKAAINIISESSKQGANSLTPSCAHDDDTKVCDSLTNDWPQYRIAAARFNAQNPGLDLNATDIYQLLSMYCMLIRYIDGLLTN